MLNPPTVAPGLDSMIKHPSGEQVAIRCGDQSAVVVEVGGGIREYLVGDRPVLDPYPADAVCDGAHGQPLIPWPNRLEDGRYGFDGTSYQVALTEPEKHNAIHGLTRWSSWSVRQCRDDMVVMGHRLHPTPGYPFALELAVGYWLDVDGLRVTIAATNVGLARCPIGVGQHPYLSAGGGLIDECGLQFEAGTRIDTDPNRQLPSGTSPVSGGRHDYATARPVGQERIDDAFTDLDRDADGRSWVRLSRPDGSVVEAWAGSGFEVLEIYTGDDLAPQRRRRGLGVEPMSCPPNALRSQAGLRTLAPGEVGEWTWGARLVKAA